MLPMHTGWQGTMRHHADRWGLSHLELLESQPTLIEFFQVVVPICFFVRVFVDQMRCCICARDGREPGRYMRTFALRAS